MPAQSYERYGLTGNPFRDLASESIEDVTIVHVNQEVDDALRTIREEIFDKENHAVVAILGALGAGKTERLLVAAAEGRERGAFVVLFDLPERADLALRGLAAEFRKTAETAKVAKAFGSPAWLRALAAFEKTKDSRFDTKAAGLAIASALNERAPSLLLLNDLHNLADESEVQAVAPMLQETLDALKPGVLVMVSCYPSYLAWLTANHPALTGRINRTLHLSPLSDEEAGLVLAKKMLAKRVVEELDPMFPFDPEAIRELNRAAGGNPRRLIELADIALEYGVSHRAYRVDVELARSALTPRAPAPAPPRSTVPRTDSPRASVAAPGPAPVHRASAPPGAAPNWSESQ